MDKTIKRVICFFALVAVILVAVAVQAVRDIGRSVAGSDWVNHTHAVILETEALRSALVSADGAMRTYALTGDARDLSAGQGSLADVASHLDIIEALTSQEAAESPQAAEIRSLSVKRADFVKATMAARQSGDQATLRTNLAADAGETGLRDIEKKIDKLKQDELALLTDRDTASYLQAQSTRWTIWSGVALDVLLLAGAVWLIRDDVTARQRAAQALREVNEQLERKVEERTAELSKANHGLSAEILERRWANQALEHQVRYSGLIVDSISDLVFVLTKATNVSRVNPAVLHWTGREAADLVNQPLSAFVRLAEPAAGASAPLRDPITAAMEDGRDLRDEPAVIADKRGGKVAVRLSLFPLRDRDKVVGGIVTLQIVRPSRKPNL